MESCQIYFITKLKYNLRKLNTEGLVRSSLVINCCNTAVECLHGCSIKKTFSHGYFERGTYRTFFIRKSHMKFRHIQVYMMNLISKVVHFLMSIHYVVTLRYIFKCDIVYPFSIHSLWKKKKKTPQSYKICFLNERNPLELYDYTCIGRNWNCILRCN